METSSNTTPVVNEAIVGTPPEPAVTAPVTPEVTPEQTPIAKRKIKWGDQEKEVSFDEAVQLAQKAFGIEGKMKEVSTKAQQAEALLDMLGNNPKAFRKQCKLAGIDADKLATELLWTKLEEDKLSPEERELREYKEKESERLEAEKQAKDAAEQAELDKKTTDWAQKFEKELQTALSAKKIPMSRLALALAAQYIDAGLAQKKEYTVEQVIPYVERDLKNIHMDTMGKLDGDDLLNYIGEEMSNKIAAARVARYKKSPAPAPAQKTEKKGPLSPDITKLKGKAYWKALRMQKSEDGIGVFPGAE